MFRSIKHHTISRVVPEERFIFGGFSPKEHQMFWCVARYGCSDVGGAQEFAVILVDRLKKFIKEESAFTAQNKPAGRDDESNSEVPEARARATDKGIVNRAR
jgi:KUP system potassium uptake protein